MCIIDPFQPRFGIGRFPVTNHEYKTFIEATQKQSPPLFLNSIFSDPEQPVVAVSWEDAAAYCAWLSQQRKASFRLPSEAEWERAARGGLEAALYPWGDEPPSDNFVGCNPETGGPAKIGVNAPNGFGLYDMSENVHEWCADWYEKEYYGHSPEQNPAGPDHGVRRAARGGAWRHANTICRVTLRSGLDPSFRYNDFGFRLARSC